MIRLITTVCFGIMISGIVIGGVINVPEDQESIQAGINAARLVAGRDMVVPPSATAHGALVHHLTGSDPSHFQPSNVNFGLFPPLGKKMKKRERGKYRSELALSLLEEWKKEL